MTTHKRKAAKEKMPTLTQLRTTITCLSVELAAVQRLRREEQEGHVKFLNEVRTRAFGFKQLPLDLAPKELAFFRDDMLTYLSKFVEAATRKGEPAKEPEQAVKKRDSPLTV